MDSNFWYRGTKAVDFRSIPSMAGFGVMVGERHALSARNRHLPLPGRRTADLAFQCIKTRLT